MGFNSAFKGLKHGIEKLALRSINLLIVLGIRRNSFYKKGDKADRSNCTGISLFNYVQNSIHHPPAKLNSICRGNYRRSSMRISTQHVNH